MQERPLTTAHEAWSAHWADEAARAEWLTPDPTVTGVVPLLRARDVDAVLDVGCGVGRHAVHLARQGFTVHGVDASSTGVDYARRAAAEAGLEIDYRVGSFTELPFADGCFGYVLAWHVIYHGDGDAVRAALCEIARVLRPGGLYQGTMLSKRHKLYGTGIEIRPNTFVIPGGGEKEHPHFFCNAAELARLLEDARFELSQLRDHDNGFPGQNHWELVAERG